MSALLPTDQLHEPTRSQRDRENSLRLLRQLMAQGARVVRLGRRSPGMGDNSSRRPPAHGDAE